MRSGDIRSIPVAVWPLLGLALLDLYLLSRERGLLLDLSDAPSFFVRVAPFLFAAVVAFRSIADKRFLWGALALCGNETSAMLSFLLPDTDALLSLVDDAFRSVVWVLTLAGLVLIGTALGGVKAMTGRLAVAFGALVFVASEVSYWALVPSLLSETDIFFEPLVSRLSIAIGFVSPTVFISWGYLLGAGLERGSRYAAVGAGLILGLAAIGVAMSQIAPAAPGTDFTITNLVSLTARVVAWLALIVAAAIEFGREAAPTKAADNELAESPV